MEQKRFILAMVLSGLVIVFWQMIFTPPPVPPEIGEDGTVVERGEDIPAAPPASRDQSPEAPPAQRADFAPPTPVPAREIALRTDRIESENFQLEFTNQGAAVSSILITSPEQYMARGDLLDAFPQG